MHIIIVAITLFVVWAFFGLRTIHAETLNFGNTLTGIFPGIDTNYSSIYFQYGGNSQVGMLFWTDSDTISPSEPITISGWTQTIRCSTKLNGLYYSNARGQSIWPLDTWNQQKLISGGYTDYLALQTTWWLYTNCVASGTFSINNNAIFGQIDHTISGTQYHIIAGMDYNFSTNTISGATFMNNFLMNNGGSVTGFIYDNYGGIGFVGGTGNGCTTNCSRISGSVCSGFSISTPITYGNNSTINCRWSNPAGYMIQIFTIGGWTQIYVSSTGNTRNTGSSLPAGTYNVSCTAAEGWSCGSWYVLTVNNAIVWSGNSCGLAGNTTIVGVPWTVAQASAITPDYYYSRTTGNISIQVWSNMPSNYQITSPGIINSVAGTYAYSYNPPAVSVINTGTLTLTSGDGQKQITTTFTTGTCTSTSLKRITLDLLAPTTPTLTYPVNGSGICYVGNFNFTRNAASDSGIWISTYNYKIANNPYFSAPIINSSTTWTTFSLNASQLGTGYFSGTYYWEVAAIDGLLQTGAYATGTFTVDINNCSNTGNILIHGTIPRVRNADLNKNYLSDPFTVDNLPWTIIAYISTGVLYINGTWHGTSGYINNGDELNIRLTSSTQYDTTVSSIFYVWPKHATFNLTTRSLTGYIPTSGCNLSTGQKTAISDVFTMLKEAYSGSTQTMMDFVFTMQSMLQDDVTLTDNCSLQYLLDNVDSYIIDNIDQSVDVSDHEAPNCKIYQIEYSDSKQGYTSTNLKKKIYFASRDALTRYIDSKNLWDCRRNTYNELPVFENTAESGSYIAPNGKIYTVKEKTGTGSTSLYYSPDFVKVKYFENIDDLYKIIDANNPVQEIWDHEVDADFTPITYETDNGKEYKIYKTDQGFMSYKLMKVQYFETLQEIESYIAQNNKK